jgi:hypothetical protein
MADPISCTASAATIFAFALRTCADLRALLSDLKNAPKLIMALSNEVADISVVLDRTSDVSLSLQGLTPERNAAFTTSLSRHLDSAAAILGKLDALVKSLQKGGTSINRVKWLLKKSDAVEIKSQLREVRLSINDLLVAYNV